MLLAYPQVRTPNGFREPGSLFQPELAPGSHGSDALGHHFNALIGVWLLVAAFTICSSAAAVTNDIILGVIVFVLGLGSAMASERGARTTA